MEYRLEERKHWNGEKYWVVIQVTPHGEYEEREFWAIDGDSDETAHGWSEGRGWELIGGVAVEN